MAEQKKWVVTLSKERSPEEVRKALTEAGMKVEQMLAEIGVVTAAGDDSCAERARHVPGVADVAPDQPIDIGPPGSPDTW
jgi:hypothetical protein